jgi:signal transduction histidine kinase
LRLVRERDSEQQARVRSDERAEVAAHLHDSVLQTLSLIQRNADDPQTMLTLARRQERELRNWLDPDRASRVGESIRGRLDQLATDVEELHGVPVEVVTAGDCLVDETISAALDATREATVNAAKHSGAEQVDVYAEVSDTMVEFFIRDAGCGFVREQINGDRRGLKESILGRMERAGGTAIVSSDVGEGTEIEISIARTPQTEFPPPTPSELA